MNVEITDNSNKVSGAIHQVGQAMADTGGFLQTRESLQQGHWHTRSGASSVKAT